MCGIRQADQQTCDKVRIFSEWNAAQSKTRRGAAINQFCCASFAFLWKDHTVAITGPKWVHKQMCFTMTKCFKSHVQGLATKKNHNTKAITGARSFATPHDPEPRQLLFLSPCLPSSFVYHMSTTCIYVQIYQCGMFHLLVCVPYDHELVGFFWNPDRQLGRFFRPPPSCYTGYFSTFLDSQHLIMNLVLLPCWLHQLAILILMSYFRWIQPGQSLLLLFCHLPLVNFLTLGND